MSIPGLYRFVQVYRFDLKLLKNSTGYQTCMFLHTFFVKNSTGYQTSMFLHTFFVQELIKTQVANMYLWPKTLVVPVLDPTK